MVTCAQREEVFKYVMKDILFEEKDSNVNLVLAAGGSQQWKN